MIPLGLEFDRFICRRTGKRSYRTQLEAKADIERFRRRSGRQPHRVFQCDHCYGFHLTADPRRPSVLGESYRPEAGRPIFNRASRTAGSIGLDEMAVRKPTAGVLNVTCALSLM